MNDYSYGDGHTDEELAALDELYGVGDPAETPHLTELELQLSDEGWTTDGIAWIGGLLPEVIDDENRLLLARQLAGPYALLAGDDDRGAVCVLYVESPQRADQPDEQADDRQDHEDDHDRGQTAGEFHDEHLPGWLAPMFTNLDTPGIGGVPLGINDAGVSTPPSAAS